MRARATRVPVLLLALAAAALAGCSSSGGLTDVQAPTSGSAISPSSPIPVAPVNPPPSSASPSPSDTSAPDETASGKPVAADPCDVVTKDEAEALVGHSLSGKEDETTGTAGSGKRCTYGAQTTGVFWVQIAEAGSVEEAQADWQKEEQKAYAALAKSVPGGVSKPKLGAVQGVGDRAAAAVWSTDLGGQKIALSAIYVLDGAAFLAFGDVELNRSSASVDDLKTQAQTSIGRL